MTKSLRIPSCFSHCSVSDRLLEKLGGEVLLLYFCYSALIRRKPSTGMGNSSSRGAYCFHWNENEFRLNVFWFPDIIFQTKYFVLLLNKSKLPGQLNSIDTSNIFPYSEY